MKRWIMTTVSERFTDELGIPRERLACGHLRTDPAFYYGNETAFRIRRVGDSLSDEPVKARCYLCAKEVGA